MAHSIRHSLVVVLVSLACAPAAAGGGTAAGGKVAGKSLLSILHPKLAGSVVNCTADNSPCEVPITITQVPFEGYSYCLAKLPEVINVPGSGPLRAPKSIVWNLVPPSVGATTFAFEPGNGILVVSDVNKQNPKGAIGTSPAQFIIKNLRKKTGQAIYLPVIVQTDAAGVVTLCGAWDPKIINS